MMPSSALLRANAQQISNRLPAALQTQA